jgi:hypothetical protein
VADESFDDDFYHEDFYHDDPEQETNDKPDRKKNIVIGFCASVVLLISAIFYLPSSIGGRITINTGTNVDFGKGISANVACSGNTSLTMTPYASFINSAESLTNYLSSIKVSNIPTNCRGAAFTIKAYGGSDSTPLSLFNTNSNAAIINTFNSNDSWAGAAGISVSASADSTEFTVTFTSPVALSSNVVKITLESSKTYYVGGPGPGGGIIFYISPTDFNCGPELTAKCKYLEAAPTNWNGGVENPYIPWAQSTPIDYRLTTVNNATSPQTATATAIGSGYANTLAAWNQGNKTSTTSAIASAYNHTVTVNGVVFDDWYLGSKDEVTQMGKWVKNNPWVSDATQWGYQDTKNTGPGAKGFTKWNWSSSEVTGTGKIWIAYFDGNYWADAYGKRETDTTFRPIRAF